ncbi:MAG: hypothetical protein LBT46_13120 [Planctomycetaceae bacterium]|jgi:hypothetical protein|nr:hypothetical protein [Planctomycetaceae bacterium]
MKNALLAICVAACLFGVILAQAAEPHRLDVFYSKAIHSAEAYTNKLIKDGKAEPAPALAVRELIDRSYVLAMANVDLPVKQRPSSAPILPMLLLAEEMQDKNPDSRTFGNFRWYWRTPEVTDPNAVEFAVSHALPIWFEARKKLPSETQEVLKRVLQRCTDGCLGHRVRPDYTNIAIYNAVHLIILGQIFDRSDALTEGERRLKMLLFNIWDHGIYEYNTPTYYAVDVDALQLGLRYVENTETKKSLQKLLELFWTDLALNWYKPALRQAGATSRSYNYLHGTGAVTRLMSFAGLAPVNDRTYGTDMLNAFHSPYKPSPKILALNDRYPRHIVGRWGSESNQVMTSYILDDIALGTSGAKYRSMQDINLAVDLGDCPSMPDEPQTILPRNYFIADGREDPYGKKRYSTGSAGHQKALHSGAFWMGAQRTVDALGVSLYTQETLKNPLLTHLQSHFVFRKPDVIVLGGNTVALLPGKPVEISKQTSGEDKSPAAMSADTVVFRYGKKAFGIRVLWTRDTGGNSPSAYLIDDGNEYGVYRLTVEHGQIVPENQQNQKGAAVNGSPGAALWVRIGSHLETDALFKQWCQTFSSAKTERLAVTGDDIDIQVTGADGLVAVGKETLPPLPGGILNFNGQDLGCPLLEQIPFIADAARRKKEAVPISVTPSGTYWESESGCGYWEEGEADVYPQASGGKAVKVRSSGHFWLLDIPQIPATAGSAGTAVYYLWGRVFAADAQHDSFHIRWSKQGEVKENGGEWHIGSGQTWRWIPLQLNQERKLVPLRLDEGIWRLALWEREPDGLIDRFFLTTDPDKVPE